MKWYKSLFNEWVNEYEKGWCYDEGGVEDYDIIELEGETFYWDYQLEVLHNSDRWLGIWATDSVMKKYVVNVMDYKVWSLFKKSINDQFLRLSYNPHHWFGKKMIWLRCEEDGINFDE